MSCSFEPKQKVKIIPDCRGVVYAHEGGRSGSLDFLGPKIRVTEEDVLVVSKVVGEYLIFCYKKGRYWQGFFSAKADDNTQEPLKPRSYET